MTRRRSKSGSDNHSVFSWVIVAACAVVSLSPAAYCEELKQTDAPVHEYAKQMVKDLTKGESNNPTKDHFQISKEETSPTPGEETKNPLDVMPEGVDSSLKQDELRGPARWFFNTRIGQRIAKFESGDIRKRPMMYWRRFADRQLPPIRTFLFLLFFNLAIGLAFKKRVSVASECVRKSFWKSMFAGWIFVIIAATAARLCFDSVLFTPVALLVLGVAEFLGLCGFAVTSRTIGYALLTKLGYIQAEAGGATAGAGSGSGSGDSTEGKRKEWLKDVPPILVGTVIFTLIALIPGLGPLPRLGTRFLMWFAVLGIGALVRTKVGRKELP